MVFLSFSFGFMAIICLFVIVVASGMIFALYQKRQLVKANFWLNVAIFALLVIITLVYIMDACTTDTV